MKEYNYKKESELYTSELQNGVKIKPFVTWSELSEIYKLVGAQDNGFMRHYAKVVGFAKVCTNIDFDGIENTEIYDICAELKLIDEFSISMSEFYEVDKMVKKDESTYDLIKGITDGLQGTLATLGENGNVDKLKEVLLSVNK